RAPLPAGDPPDGDPESGALDPRVQAHAREVAAPHDQGPVEIREPGADADDQAPSSDPRRVVVDLGHRLRDGSRRAVETVELRGGAVDERAVLPQRAMLVEERPRVDGD